jgi:hypothetical protein
MLLTAYIYRIIFGGMAANLKVSLANRDNPSTIEL